MYIYAGSRPGLTGSPGSRVNPPGRPGLTGFLRKLVFNFARTGPATGSTRRAGPGLITVM